MASNLFSTYNQIQVPSGYNPVIFNIDGPNLNTPSIIYQPDEEPDTIQYQDVQTEVPLVSKEKPVVKKKEDTLTTLIKTLVNNGLTLASALAAASIAYHESKLNPLSVSGSEKKNKGTSLTKGGGYGAGLWLWTGVLNKKEALRSIGLDPSKTSIEDLDLETLCKMLVADFSKKVPKTWEAFKKCEDPKQALRIMYSCMIGGTSNVPSLATESYCNRIANRYMNTHQKLGYKVLNGYKQRMQYLNNLIKQYETNL